MARTFTDEQRKVHKAKQAAKRLAKAVDMKVLLSEACVHTGVSTLSTADVENFANRIIQSKSSKDNCCLFYAMANCLDNPAHRLAFCSNMVTESHKYFQAFIRQTQGYDGRNGYDERHVMKYLELLKDRGLIQSWTFKRLKKCDIRALILGRLETRPDDNIVIFGRAKRKHSICRKPLSVFVLRAKKRCKARPVLMKW